MKTLLSSLINSLYPPTCLVCEKILKDDPSCICNDCLSAINWLTSDFFNSGLKKVYFNSAWSLAAYEGGWQDLVHRFKYNRRTDLAKPLARLLSPRADYEYDLILPLPLHPKRLRERGYNQSALLAKAMAHETGFKYTAGAIKRVIHSRPQVGLSGQERVQNIKGAFICRSPDKICGGDILLIDDVMTTGATANECAKVLKKAGAKRVDVLTLARAGL